MKALPGSGERADLAVILARGTSSRMRIPKGLVLLPDDSRPLLTRVMDLYRELEIPVLVVTRGDTASAYREILGDCRNVELVPAEPGGGTGRTLAIAWGMVKDRVTHLWAHPVDLPLVRTATLERLRDLSQVTAGKIFRPTHEGSPGHPVVLPASALAALDEPPGLFEFEGDMKERLTVEVLSGMGLALEEVEVADPGVIRDFDTPDY